MSTPALAQQIFETVSRLPDVQAREVLDFAYFIEQRKNQTGWHDLQNAQLSALSDFWDNPEDEVWNDA